MKVREKAYPIYQSALFQFFAAALVAVIILATLILLVNSWDTPARSASTTDLVSQAHRLALKNVLVQLPLPCIKRRQQALFSLLGERYA